MLGGGVPSGLTPEEHEQWVRSQAKLLITVMIGLPLVIGLICGLVIH